MAAASLNSSEVIKPQYVVDTLWRLTQDRDTYITSDVGQIVSLPYSP